MVLLLNSIFAVIEHLPEARLVRIVRSHEPFGDLRLARTELGDWAAVLQPLDRSDLAILLDWRLTPMTSDPDILRAVVSQADAIALSFPRQAMLLAAPLAGLQSERVARAGASVIAFWDESAALAHLGSG